MTETGGPYTYAQLDVFERCIDQWPTEEKLMFDMLHGNHNATMGNEVTPTQYAALGELTKKPLSSIQQALHA